jgi:NACalpha-BTF3-like transcription factor
MNNDQQLIPCEICNEMIHFNQYTAHVPICMRRTQLAGFFMRQQRQYEAEHDHDRDQEEDTEEDEEDSAEDHRREIATFASYFTRNSQISRISLRDFINDHFNGVSSPPTRSVIWFNITTAQSPSTSVASSYDANLRLADTIGKVEVGLTEQQLAETTYSSDNYEELHIKEDDICPICQDKLASQEEKKKACLVACGHTYCDACIKKWLKKSKKCPVCMVDLEDAYCWGRSS